MSLDPKSVAAQLIAAAAAKDKPKEPEMVELTQFLHPNGTKYFAKVAKTKDCMTYPLMKKLVVKGSKEDQ